MWVGVLVNNITFPLLPFEINSLCSLRLPWGITLINPNNSCIIAFSFTQNSKGNHFSHPCIYNATRIHSHHNEHERRNRKCKGRLNTARACIFSSINCTRLRMQKIPWHFTSLPACSFPTHSSGSNNASISAPSNRLPECRGNSEEY